MSTDFEKIVAWAKRRAFVFPGSSIYWGLANSWDFWPYGILLKNNVKDIWWKEFVQKRLDMVWLDAAILMNPKVWIASWHVWWFSDPLIDCKKCNNRFRADKLIENYMFEKKDEETPANWAAEKTPSDDVLAYLSKKDIKCPNCGKLDWSDVKQFNLMYKTYQWVTDDSSSEIYLRPETAQWIFVNFKNVIDTTRMRVPFGIAQVGKAFRNEITPWNFLYRVREFEQMEIEYFVEPWKEANSMEMWKELSKDWRMNKIWIKQENMRFRAHMDDELSHYSNGTFDIEYLFPWGWNELQGIASRTNFDLKSHQDSSGQNMQYTDPKTGQRYIPYVIEPSWGLTRAAFVAMLDAYEEETYTAKNGEQESRVVLRFNKNVAPIKFAILPLIEKNEEMVKFAQDLYSKLAEQYQCEYDAWWNIWKRYRRQDEIWTPYCLTIDYQTLEDWTVTIRDRDSMEQTRINIQDIKL